MLYKALVTFAEGLMSFFSPCILPLIPVYVLRVFSVGDPTKSKRSNLLRTLLNALAFVLGFTVVYVLLGLLAASAGRFLVKYNTVLNIICGIVMCLFGLSVVFSSFGLSSENLQGLNIPHSSTSVSEKKTLPGTFVFGMTAPLIWTPCVGPYLGSALMLAATSATAASGVILLLCYSAGLGVPLVLCAVLLEWASGVITFIKKHYRAVKLICGILLILIGVFTAFGIYEKFVLKWSSL